MVRIVIDLILMGSLRNNESILRKMILNPFPGKLSSSQKIRNAKKVEVESLNQSVGSGNLPPVKMFKAQHMMFPCFVQEPIKRKITVNEKNWHDLNSTLNIIGKHYKLNSIPTVASHPKLQKNLRLNLFVSKIKNNVFKFKHTENISSLQKTAKHAEKKKIKETSLKIIKKNNLKDIVKSSEFPENYRKQRQPSTTIKGW